MRKVLLIGADVHDKNILAMFALGQDEPRKRSFANTVAGRAGLARWFQKYAEKGEAKRIVFAYEASGAGFGLYDVLTEARIECQVSSAKQDQAFGAAAPAQDRRARRATDFRGGCARFCARPHGRASVPMPAFRRLHARLVRKNPKKKKIATVACMRHLGIRMWHEALRNGTAG